MSHASRLSLAYWSIGAHAVEKRLYASQRSNVGTSLVCFKAPCNLAAQPGQFRAPRLRVGLTAKSDERNHPKDGHTRPHQGISSHRSPPRARFAHSKPPNTADLRPRDGDSAFDANLQVGRPGSGLNAPLTNPV